MATMWDESYPPSLFAPPVVAITGVTGGIPGSFQPGNATIPANIAALRADPAVGTAGTNKPGAAWTVGQYVVLADVSHAYWSGVAWLVGEAPAAEEPEAEERRSKRTKSQGSD